MEKNNNKLTYSLGTVGHDMVYKLISMYLMFYLTDILQLETKVLQWVTGIIMVARVFDAFNDPIMGVVVDNTKFGRFKPWNLHWSSACRDSYGIIIYRFWIEWNRIYCGVWHYLCNMGNF